MEEIKKSDRTHKGSLANVFSASGSVPYMLLPPHHSQELGSPGGRNMAVSLGLGKAPPALDEVSKVSPGCTWLASVPCEFNPFYKYL